MRSGTRSNWPARATSIAGPLLTLALFALPAAAGAQQVAPDCAPIAAGQPHEIHTGMCVRSTIDARDPKNENNVSYEDWALRLSAGETVQIDLDSLAPQRAPAEAGGPRRPDDVDAIPFDTYVEIRRAGATDALASNDDRASSLNSTLRFTATEAGDYVIRARPLFAGDGDYTLRVSAPPPPPVVVRLVPGRNAVRPTERGGEGLQERLFSFEGRAGQRVRLFLMRHGFGDQLRLLLPNDQELAVAGELDPQVEILAVLPQDGTYKVRALLHNVGPSPTPPTLDFETIAASPERPPQPVRIGTAVNGTIDIRSPAAPDIYGGGTLMLHQLYAVRVTAGQTITVMLESTAFDPVLDAGGMSPLGFATVQSDDDGGQGTSSLLVLRPVHPGVILLRVRALGNRMGAFRLRVVAGERAPLAQ